MTNFFYGIAFMYLLAIPLMAYIAEPVDEEDHTAPWRFALMWPLAALEVIYKILRGDSNGTGTD
jgi:hypothetical protein